MFLHEDARWKWLRSYMLETISERSTTCVFGFILAVVCPLMFGVQDFFLGMCLFKHSTNDLSRGFWHVLQTLRYQLVVLYDLTLFKELKKTGQKFSRRGVVSIVVGYVLYVLPLGGLMALSIFGHAELTLCQPLNVTFLLDNDVLPVVSMSKIYKLRQSMQHNQLKDHPHPQLNVWDDEGGLLWNYGGIESNIYGGYRAYKYWPLENITDLIKQYNYIGWHDVCIYAKEHTLTEIRDHAKSYSKGLQIVGNGYTVRNSSGTDNNKY